MNTVPSSAAAPSSGARYLALDIVRALAAVSVLKSHWSGWTSRRAGDAGVLDRAVALYEAVERVLLSHLGVHPGVVVFIVLSGFCIHLPLATATPEKLAAHSWSRYAVRRATRIAPLYWAGCALGFLALFVERARGAPAPGISGDPLVFTPALAALKLLFLEPVALTQPTYLDNGPLATVATEVWLYALYPLVLGVRRRWGFAPIFACGVVLQALSLVMVRAGFPVPRVAASLLVFFLWWWMGVWAVERFVARLRDPAQGAGWGWTAATGLAYVLAHHTVHFRGAHYLVNLLLACFSAALLSSCITAEVRRGDPLGAGLRAAAWLGERSYSLYAVHAPVLVLSIVAIERWLPDRPLVMRALPLGVVAVTAALSFQWIERPSIRLGAWLTTRRPSPMAPTTGSVARP